MTPSEKVLSKTLVASGLDSAGWDTVAAGLKDRAFWSSRIESVRHLQAAQNGLADLLQHARNADGAITSRAQIVSDLMRSAKELGLATGAGGLADPGSEARAKVIVDTNAGLARSYVAWTAGATPGARAAYPADELVRIERRNEERDWRARWDAAGGKLHGGRMIALRTDTVWIRISRFGVPWPPFDYGSGMGVQGVSYEECVRLGLVAEGWTPEPAEDPVRDFNGHLEAEIDFKGADDPGWLWLQEQFGDQVRHAGGKIQWQGDVIMDAIRSTSAGERAPIRLGIPTEAATERLREAGIELPARRLTTDTGLVRHALASHGAETRADQAPLTETDARLLPHVWRDPDRAFREGDGICLAKRLAGGELRMVLEDKAGQTVLKSLYKKK